MVRRTLHDNISLADALTRTAILQVLQTKNFQISNHFINHAFLLYEFVAGFDPSIRKSIYYEILMWHRVYLSPLPQVLEQTYLWAKSYKTQVLSHVLFLKIITNIYPQFNETKFDTMFIRTYLPPERDRNYFLNLCDEFRWANPNTLLKFSITTLRHWILWDFDSTMSSIEDYIEVIPTQNVEFLTDPLPIQIELWVSIQLYTIIINSPHHMDDYWKQKKIKLREIIRELRNITSKNLIKVWSMPIETFNNSLYEQYINMDCSEAF